MEDYYHMARISTVLLNKERENQLLGEPLFLKETEATLEMHLV